MGVAFQHATFISILFTMKPFVSRAGLNKQWLVCMFMGMGISGVGSHMPSLRSLPVLYWAITVNGTQELVNCCKPQTMKCQVSSSQIPVHNIPYKDFNLLKLHTKLHLLITLKLLLWGNHSCNMSQGWIPVWCFITILAICFATSLLNAL